jgi:hypothetical protein
MKQITVRNVSTRGLKRARELALERSVSLNDVYLDALEKGLGLAEEKPTNGLERFAGDSDFGPKWQQYLEKDLNQIDEEIWR